MGVRVAKIFRPAKTAMQSGRAKTRKWRLEYEPDPTRAADPLMGWTSGSDTRSQVRLNFDTMEEAIAFAKRHNIPHQVIEPEEPKRVIKSYAENFSPDRKRPWTH